MEIEGKYARAKVFTDNLDKASIGQIRAFCDSPAAEGTAVRVMPDVHAGRGCVIGATLKLAGKVIPGMVGVDIGCGVHCVNVGQIEPDFNKLDKFIRLNVPIGKRVRKTPHRFSEDARIKDLTVAKAVDMERTYLSVGSLGGGNHFIEMSRHEDSGDWWLIIHSGSRNPGLQVAVLHQKIAGETRPEDVPFELAWLEGQTLDNYLNDMSIMQEFASLNRAALADTILKGMKWKKEDSFETIHNYIDIERGILRKGAVSAQKGERLIVPINMRDGSLLCEGLGNEDWNMSAPHGAGRLLSRTQAKEQLTLTNFKNEMAGVFSTTISQGTLDESPEAYKPMEEILSHIGPTATVKTVLKSAYNFKAAS